MAGEHGEEHGRSGVAAVALLDRLIAAVDNGILVLSSDGHILLVNPWLLSALSLPPGRNLGSAEELVGSIPDRVISASARQELLRILRSPPSQPREVQLLNGRVLEMSVRGPGDDEAASPRIFIFRDLSTERRIRSIASHARCILYDAQVQGGAGWENWQPGQAGAFRWNITVQDEQAAQNVLPLDIPPNQTYWEAWRKARMPQDLPAMIDVSGRALKQGEAAYRQTFRCRDRFGRIRWMYEVVSLESIAHGQWRAFGVCMDVTEAKRVEAELRESDERFHLFMDNLPGIALIKDAQGRLEYLNKGAVADTPQERKHDWKHKTSRDLYPLEIAEPLMQHDQEVLLSGHPIQVVEKIPQADGVHHYLTTKFPYISGDGRTWLGGIAVDITELRQAQLEVQRQKRLLETVIEAAPVGMLLISPEAKWLLHNKRFTEVWPVRAEVMSSGDMSAKKREFARIIHDADGFTDRLLAVLRDPTARVEEKIKLLNGRTVIRTSVPVLSDDGSHLGRVSYVQDITAHEQASQRLRALAFELTRAEENERRRLARLLHDDIGQLLSFALMKLTEVQADVPREVADRLDEVHEIVSRSLDTTRDLTVQLRPPVLHESGLFSALKWLASHLLESRNIHVDYEIREAPQPSQELSLLIYQCVRELLTNIVKHSRATSVIMRCILDGDWLRVTIEDNGQGFDISVRGSQFEKGNYFGLFNVREQLAYVGGTLELQSQVKRFTRVTLSVPLTTREQG